MKRFIKKHKIALSVIAALTVLHLLAVHYTMLGISGELDGYDAHDESLVALIQVLGFPVFIVPELVGVHLLAVLGPFAIPFVLLNSMLWGVAGWFVARKVWQSVDRET